jgi:hypothetical protein
MNDTRKIYLISPWAVPVPANLPVREVKHQAERLKAEGQIEPIALLPDDDPDLDSWAYAREQIQAARELGWKDILVTYNPAVMTGCTETDSCNCIVHMSQH